MSRGSAQVGSQPAGFPRVSGDEPRRLRGRRLELWFSPRERG